MSFSDAELIEALPRVRRHALKITRDLTAADDLVQLVSERALRRRAMFISGTNLQAWLGTLTYNAWIDQKRDETRRNEVELNESDVGTDAKHDPEAIILLHEVEAAMRRLSPGQAESLTSIALGYTYDESSMRLGIPRGTVRSRLGRGREALRAIVEV